MTFNDFVLDFWKDFITDNPEPEVVMSELLDIPVGTVGDYLDVGQTPESFLQSYDNAVNIFDTFFPIDTEDRVGFGLKPRSAFLSDMIYRACLDTELNGYDFCAPFIDEWAVACASWNTPSNWFSCLQDQGEADFRSGSPLLKTVSACDDFYVEYMDDIEQFKRDWENGHDIVVRSSETRHSVWMCAFCYKCMALTVADELWPGQFD